jgi:hypothetical protein
MTATPLDLAAEKAASRERAEQQWLATRAQLLLEDLRKVGTPVSHAALGRAAEERWPAKPDAERARFVEAAMATRNTGREEARERAREEEVLESARIWELVDAILVRRPDTTAGTAWDEVCRLGRPGIKRSSFDTAFYGRKRKLGLSGRGKGRKKQAPTQKASATPAEREPPAPTKEAPGPRLLDPHDSPGPHEPGSGVPAVARGDASASAPSLNGSGPGLPAPAAGLIELATGEDGFRATRRDDGEWDVELRARMDEEEMGRLAALLWGRVTAARRGPS